MKIRTPADVEAYRAAIGPADIPVICEAIVVKDRNGRDITVRVTGFLMPVTERRVETAPRYMARHYRGRLSLVVGGTYPAALAPHPLRFRPRAFVHDANEWLREAREEWDGEDRAKAESAGRILVRPCLREQATHVEHYAVAGGIARIDRIQRTGRMCWSTKACDGEAESHKERVGSVTRFDWYEADP